MVGPNERLLFRYTKYDIFGVVAVVLILMGSCTCTSLYKTSTEAGIEMKRLEAVKSCYDTGNTDCSRIR